MKELLTGLEVFLVIFCWEERMHRLNLHQKCTCVHFQSPLSAVDMAL